MHRALASLKYRIRDQRSRLVARQMMRGMRSLGVDALTGVRMLDATADGVRDDGSIRRVREAHELLHAHEIAQARWLTRYVNQIILVEPMPVPAAFEHFSRSILLDRDAGSRFDGTGLAALLVHEAAHARMAGLGVRPAKETFSVRRRIERRCVREQLEVLLRIDPDHYFVPWSRELLSASGGEQLTPSQAQRSATLARTYRRVRQGGYPRWIGRLVVYAALALERR